MTQDELDDAIRPAVSQALAEREAAAAEQQVTATTPPVGITSRMVFAIVLLAIAGFTLVTIYVLADTTDVTLRSGIVKSWDWAFAMAIGYILGSSAGSRNKERHP